MEDLIFRNFKYCICKFKAKKKHVEGEYNALHACKSKFCIKRHHKVCKRFSLDTLCKFGDECAYRHPLDRSDEVQNLSAQNEEEIIKL